MNIDVFTVTTVSL